MGCRLHDTYIYIPGIYYIILRRIVKKYIPGIYNIYIVYIGTIITLALYRSLSLTVISSVLFRTTGAQSFKRMRSKRKHAWRQGPLSPPLFFVFYLGTGSEKQMMHAMG